MYEPSPGDVMTSLRAVLWRLAEDEGGQDLVEYAFLVAFLSLLIVATLRATETSIGAVYSKIIDAIDGA